MVHRAITFTCTPRHRKTMHARLVWPMYVCVATYWRKLTVGKGVHGNKADRRLVLGPTAKKILKRICSRCSATRVVGCSRRSVLWAVAGRCPLCWKPSDLVWDGISTISSKQQAGCRPCGVSIYSTRQHPLNPSASTELGSFHLTRHLPLNPTSSIYHLPLNQSPRS
jgi:hypothetical protein